MIDFNTPEVERKKQAFLVMMNNLNQIWPGINNKSRLKKYFQYLEKLPEKAWDEISDTLMDNHRTMPLPKDFQEAATAWKRANNYFVGNDKEQQESIYCQKCFDSGVLFIKTKSTEPTVFVFCDCYFGTKSLHAYDEMMPQWNKTFFQMGFEIQPFDVEFFKPKIQGEITLNKISTTVERFRKKLYESRDYFNSLGKRQASGELQL